MQSNAADWPRVRIVGHLTCRSPLHVGDGGHVPFEERDLRPDQQRPEVGGYNSVCLDVDGCPYIPASTLRGYLRAGLRPKAPGAKLDQTLAEIGRDLFGEIAGDQGNAGKLRVFDARLAAPPPATKALPLWSERRHTVIRHGVAIAPRTNTVADRKFHRHEAVPADTRFEWELEASEISPPHLSLLLGLLSALNGKIGSNVGRGTGVQAGRLEWNCDRIDVLERSALLKWLTQDDAPLADAFVPMQTEPDPTLLLHRSERPTLGFTLLPRGLLLVNDPGLCRPQSDDVEEKAHEPQLEYSRTPGGRAMVPATSLKGLLRARSRRILGTIASSYSCDERLIDRVAETLVETLFGSADARGRIWITDAIATTSCSELVQTFVAIDRFTGGAANQKLYKARAADCESLRGSCAFDHRNGGPEDWECGLMVLVARDALEGDLAVGWGKARGYGACEIQLEIAGTPIHRFEPLLAAVTGESDMQVALECAGHWVDTLHQSVEAAVAAIGEEEEKEHA